MPKTKEQEAKEPSMSAQQRRFTKGTFATYKEFVVGSKGYFGLAIFEIYQLLFSAIPGLLGLGIRSLVLPLFFKKTNGRVTIGKNVTLRQPQCISIEKGAIVDDYAILDVRGDEDSEVQDQVGIEIGRNSFIGRGTTLAAKNAKIVLGQAVNISTDCRIATQSSISIGDSVLIAAYVYIGPGNHQAATDDTPLIERAMDIKGGVSIGEHAWIGTRATILDGVKIGKRAVVGAHSLVREDVPDGAVVAGCPAKIIPQK